MEQKNKIEKEKQELENKLVEMKNNFEKEKQKLTDLDKNFYQYKLDVEEQNSQTKEKTERLEKEINEKNEYFQQLYLIFYLEKIHFVMLFPFLI